MKKHNMAHNDLKLGNIVIHDDYAKIIDLASVSDTSILSITTANRKSYSAFKDIGGLAVRTNYPSWSISQALLLLLYPDTLVAYNIELLGSDIKTTIEELRDMYSTTIRLRNIFAVKDTIADDDENTAFETLLEEWLMKVIARYPDEGLKSRWQPHNLLISMIINEFIEIPDAWRPLISIFLTHTSKTYAVSIIRKLVKSLIKYPVAKRYEYVIGQMDVYAVGNMIIGTLYDYRDI
jgi:hypothetical protein